MVLGWVDSSSEGLNRDKAEKGWSPALRQAAGLGRQISPALGHTLSPTRLELPRQLS